MEKFELEEIPEKFISPLSKIVQSLFDWRHQTSASIAEANIKISSSKNAGNAIRQVTQLNNGKKTAGVDGKKCLNFEERFKLNELLKTNVLCWKHSKLREISISKKDGTSRILKIPTIKDRAWQCLIKYAIEPAHEATFHARNYGFRPGRSAHDAQKYVFENLADKHKNQYIHMKQSEG